MKHVAVAFTLLICAISHASLCAAQTCEVLKDENGQQSRNGSQLCVSLRITNGALDIDRSRSQFAVSDEFKRRLSIPPAEAEQIVFTTLSNVLKNIQKPYRLALSDADKIRDDKGELNDDPRTDAIRTANLSWTEYLQQFDDWASSTNRESMQDVFSDFESTALTPLVNAETSTALLVWQDGSFDAEQGTFNLTVLDPINNWADETQVKISFPDLPAGPKTDAKRKRIEKLLRPMAGRPRCYECMKATLENYYKRMGFDPEIDFDDRNTSPLRIGIIESKRIVSISWRSLENDPNIDKLLYSLLTDKAFRHYVKQRANIGSIFNYRQQTGEPGPYLNAQRLQIQQLLVTQLGYAASLSPAAGEAGTSSSFNITIQKLSPDDAEDGGSSPAPANEHPEPAPATANPEGVVTAHEQEEKNETDFHPKRSDDKPKDKKRYVGGGFEYQPDQGVKFFALGQVSRVPLAPGAVNNLSVKVGGFGDAGVLGNANYFADYIFFNKLHRRMSVQFTVASDLENDRNLTAPNTDERRSTGLARLEFELFRDRSGSLLRFSTEARNETVELKSNLEPLVKANMTTLEFAAFYLFERVEVELPRRIRFEPKFRAGLGLAIGEPRYNKFLATGNFHQVLPARYEFDVTGRAEVASQSTPRFELPALGGTDNLRGFRADDGFGRKLWTLQNEVWIPLTIGNDQSTGLKAMLREKVKIASFVDVGGLYDTIDVSPGMRVGTGMGLRVIYNPIIFKFDFGYGFGEKATSGGRGKFHFSVTSNLPF